MDISAVLDNFRAHGFAPCYFETASEAADYLCSTISGKTVGIGGSITVEQLNVYDRLCGNNEVYWHWKTGGDTRSKASAAQVYLCSANGLSETGEIVNIDGTGNRLAATLCGRERMIFLAGVNKLCPTLHEAIDRAKNVASPLNARRMERKTPCALCEPMRCHDCSSPDRICGSMVITDRAMHGNAMTELVLIGEELGY